MRLDTVKKHVVNILGKDRPGIPARGCPARGGTAGTRWRRRQDVTLLRSGSASITKRAKFRWDVAEPKRRRFVCRPPSHMFRLKKWSFFPLARLCKAGRLTNGRPSRRLCALALRFRERGEINGHSKITPARDDGQLGGPAFRWGVPPRDPSGDPEPAPGARVACRAPASRPRSSSTATVCR